MLRDLLTGNIVLGDGVDIVRILWLLAGIDRACFAIFIECRARSVRRIPRSERELIALHTGLGSKCNGHRNEQQNSHQQNGGESPP